MIWLWNSYYLWESHTESVKASRTQVSQIKDGLIQLTEVNRDGKVGRDVESLVNGAFTSFEFVVSLVIWHEVLYGINLVSKKLQSKDVILDIEMQNLKRLVVYFKKYREMGQMCY